MTSQTTVEATGPGSPTGEASAALAVPPAKGLRGHPWLTLFAVAIGVMMVALDGTVVAIANPAIQLDLGERARHVARRLRSAPAAADRRDDRLLAAGRLPGLAKAAAVGLAPKQMATAQGMTPQIFARITDVVHDTFLTGMGLAFAVAGVVAVFAALVAVFTKRGSHAPEGPVAGHIRAGTHPNSGRRRPGRAAGFPYPGGVHRIPFRRAMGAGHSGVK